MLEHPDITCAERTGYPSWSQVNEVYCEHCYDEIDGEIYEDDTHEYLCEHCLLKLHLKDRW